VQALAARIKEIEHETDVITHACVERLHKTFITPLDREDIHQLISRMDDVMDYIESAAAAVMLYGLTEMTAPAKALAEVLVRATETVAVAVAGLRNMNRAESILNACIEVNRLENEGYEILRSALAELFRSNGDPLMLTQVEGGLRGARERDRPL
jgi:uncharacterized protein Yka (UPF0111/DUF47 family)